MNITNREETDTVTKLTKNAERKQKFSEIDFDRRLQKNKRLKIDHPLILRKIVRGQNTDESKKKSVLETPNLKNSSYQQQIQVKEESPIKIVTEPIKQISKDHGT